MSAALSKTSRMIRVRVSFHQAHSHIKSNGTEKRKRALNAERALGDDVVRRLLMAYRPKRERAKL